MLHVRHTEEGLRREKFSNFFSKMLDNLTHRCRQTGHFFPKLVYFLSILKRQGRPPTFPLGSFTPKLLYFLNLEADTAVIFSAVECPNSAKLHF